MSFSINSPSQGVASLNDLTGALALIAGSNITITPSGTNITIAASGGGGGGSSTGPINNVQTSDGAGAFLSTDPLNALATYTSNFFGSASTFIGNDSDNDQTNQAIVLGSTDSNDLANSTSLVILAGGDLTNSGTSGSCNGVVISGGTVENGSGSGGSIQISAGSIADGSGTPGNVSIQGGQNSVGGTGGGVSISGGNGSSDGTILLNTPTGLIQFKNGSQGTAGHVWTSTDTNGTGHWATAGGGLPDQFLASNTYPSNVEGTNPAIVLIAGDASTEQFILGTQDEAGDVNGSRYLTLTTGAVTSPTNAASVGTGEILLYTGDNLSTTISTGTPNATGPIELSSGSPAQGFPGQLILGTGTSPAVNSAVWGSPSMPDITLQPGTVTNGADTVQGVVRVDGSLLLVKPSQTQPSAVSTMQGALWYAAGGAGVADTLQICMKSAANTYSWVTIATG